MDYKPYFIVLLLVMFFNCKSYEPFYSYTHKKESIKYIKKYIPLTQLEIDLIKNEDSILYMLSVSARKKIKSKLIKRRLDSFFLNSYSKKELIGILELDRLGNGYQVEFDRDTTKKYRKDIKSVENLKKESLQIQNSLPNGVELILVKDSLR